MPPRPGVHELATLVEQLGRDAVLNRLNIHRTTLMRWETGAVRIPDRTLYLIRQLLGHLPGTDGKWQGWRFWEGKLWNPAGDHWEPHDLEGQHWERQLISSLKAENAALRAQVKALSVDPWVRERAANDMTDGVAKAPRNRGIQ